jgi:hypothetical protein
VRLLETFDPKHGIAPARIQVERPRAFVVDGSADAHRDGVLQAEQAADDDRPVGPWAGPADDEAVAVALDGPLRPATGDAVGDV